MTQPDPTRPTAKGWCPGAYRPMMSGDGLVVRVRPMLARITADQALGLCDLALKFGSGLIDLTSRNNLQIRGVAEQDHETLLQALSALELLPDDPDIEARRNVLVPFDRQDGDDSHQIACDLIARLGDLPDLPAKMGSAVDAGAAPVFSDCSADFRIESGPVGLILRADGASKGRPVTRSTAVDALIEMAEWFVETGGWENRRMAAHVTKTSLPEDWTTHAPLPKAALPTPGVHSLGTLYGAGFGQIEAAALADLVKFSGCRALRVTPWRLFLTEDAAPVRTDAFITQASDPLLNVDACPGAPLCTSSSVETRALARALAGKTHKHLHISGCAKGCARPRPSSLTLIGRDGAFDLVKNGLPWDAPELTGLTPDDLTTRIEEF